MGNLRENVDELKRINKIPSDSALLQMIYYRIGKESDPRVESGNFSKMLNGGRTIPLEYLKAMEDIFNVNLAAIYEGKKTYKKYNPRGLEYTAIQDSIEAYEKLYSETNSSGTRIFGNYDEYENTILDYIIKYHSLKGVRFMFQTGIIEFQGHMNRFNFKENLYLDGTNEKHFDIIKMIFEMDDEELFKNAFDLENLFCIYNQPDCMLFSDEFIKLCLESNNIFHYLIKKHIVSLEKINPNVRPLNYTVDELYICHPLLNYMIRFALARVNVYRDKLEDILKCATSLNYSVVNHIKNEMDLHSINSLKVNNDGEVLDGHCRLGFLVTYSKPVDPDLDDDIKRRLNELKLYVNELTFADSYSWDGTLKSQWIRQDEYILRKASDNDVEYEMLDKMKKAGYDGVPVLVSHKDAVDKFEFIEGKNQSGFTLSENWVSPVARYFKEFHKVCNDILGTNKVYTHGSLKVKDLVFDEDDEIKAIVDWSKCSIGRPEDDLIYIIVNWISLSNLYYSTERENRLEVVKYFMNEYGASKEIKENFGNKIADYVNACISKLEKSDKHYKDLFYKCKETLIFVELYLDELNNM